MNYSFDTLSTFQECDRLLTSYFISQHELENRLQLLQKKHEVLVKRNEASFVALAMIRKKKARLLGEISKSKSPVRIERLTQKMLECNPRLRKILDEAEKSIMPLLFEYEAEIGQILIELNHLQPLIAGICKQRVSLND